MLTGILQRVWKNKVEIVALKNSERKRAEIITVDNYEIEQAKLIVLEFWIKKKKYKRKRK